MAISPLSRSLSPVSTQSPVASARSAAQAPQPAQARTAGLQGLLQKDGFDGPGRLAGAEGLQKLAQLLSTLSELAHLLGGEGKAMGGAAQPGACGAPGPVNASAQGRSVSGPVGQGFGGVPTLGGEAAKPVGSPMPTAMNAPLPVSPVEGGVVARPGKAAAAPGLPPVDAKQKAAAPQGTKQDGNTLTLNNDGDKPMTVTFTPNAGEKQMPSITLQPGERNTVKFPEGWSGNFRSASGDGKNATLGEVKFGGGFGQTYYDVSYIEGHNAAMTMQPVSGGRKSGTLENLLASAPDAIKARGADGQTYGIKKSTTSNVQDPAVVDFFRKHVGADQGYVIPTDDASTLGSGDSNLVVHMKNLT
ncbi:hypothetical protein LY474_12100 [Myxococcus stipitatus]|uniref:hypothetical protein n=1 Tax=Myxococcus stipitatus TaxID=83455 RepID=UPI001F2F5F11|nr:hypothetical protein [Myxococcus stipitatus]MCE9668555.1 hypothetical protein [Myxococcus stipitatus]